MLTGWIEENRGWLRRRARAASLSHPPAGDFRNTHPYLRLTLALLDGRHYHVGLEWGNALRHPLWSVAPLAALAAGCACLSAEMGARIHARAAAVSPADASATAERFLAAGGGEPRTGYIGAGVQGLFPSSNELSGGLGLDVNYTANIAERFSIELSLGRAGYDADGVGAGAELKALTLGAVAQVGMPFGASRWYAGGGLVYWMNDLSGAAIDADDSLAFTVAAGADLPIAANGNLCIEVRYMLGDADLSAGGPLDLDAFAVRANYVFKY